jgi:hypothetical protein
MKISEGAYYRTRCGDVVGPMRRCAGCDDTFMAVGSTWNEDGSYLDHVPYRLDLISEVYVSDTPAAQEIKNVSSKELLDIPTKALERFERLAGTMVSEEYANGYREACKHIIHDMSDASLSHTDSDTPPADTPAPEAKTLRDEFAGRVLTGMMADHTAPDKPPEFFANLAYKYANAMMEARKK